MPAVDARSVEAMVEQLDRWLQTEFTFLDSDLLAQQLMMRPLAERVMMLDWTRRIASTQIPLGFEFTRNVLNQFDSPLDGGLIESWALHAMDAYDRSGVQAAMAIVRDVERFLRYSHERSYGVELVSVETILRHFVHGLSGRHLNIEAGEIGHCDSETIYLPPLLSVLQDRDDNFQLYKCMAAFHWAQVRFGTLRLDMGQLAALDEVAMQRFLSLDRLRLEARLQQELPGLYRYLSRFRQEPDQAGDGARWQAMRQALSQPGATAEQALSMALTETDLPPLPAALYQGQLLPARVQAVREKRIEREKARLRVALKALRHEADDAEVLASEANQERPFDLRKAPEPNSSEVLQFELELDGKPVRPPENVRQLMTSVLLDFGEIPPDHLVPAGDGEYDPRLLRDAPEDPDAVWHGTYHEEGAHLYDEWDHGRQHYRRNWCAVREKPVEPVRDGFVVQTLDKYRRTIAQLRRTFEAMRDEDRLLKRQNQGDDVDIDALVETLADSHDGSEMSDRLFTRMYRSERNIAVLFMVDMSGSTKGWINEAEREALVLLCEALQTLGDRYAIYGFSGMSRKRCEIYTIKTFDDAYDDGVRARISGIRPQDYTRMGFAIRHLSRLLNEVEAKTRILITLSDGKPDDYSDYHGEYGIEDTRRALIEARRTGIHPYCITIDEEAKDYLPQMYGPAAFTVVSKVHELPQKVSDIYRRLTV